MKYLNKNQLMQELRNKKVISISYPTLVQMIKDGLPHHPIGRHTRFIFDDVVQWIESRKTSEVPE